MHEQGTCRFRNRALSPSHTGSERAAIWSRDEFGLWAAQQLEAKIQELGEDQVAAFYLPKPIQGRGWGGHTADTTAGDQGVSGQVRPFLLVMDEVDLRLRPAPVSGFGSSTTTLKPDL